MRLSIKTRAYLAIAAAVVAAVAVVPVTFQPAGASTTACGSSCTSPVNQSAGTGEALTVSGKTASGSSVVLATASTTNSAQDWTPEQEGTVGNAETLAPGVVPSALNMLYSGDTMVEFQYAPDGVPSDLCMGAVALYDGTQTNAAVQLTQCGVSAETLWIIDQNDVSSDGYTDLISAYGLVSCTYSDDVTSCKETNAFAEPAVLMVSGSSLETAPLSEIGGDVSATQMWADFLSPAQSSSALAKKLGISS